MTAEQRSLSLAGEAEDTETDADSAHDHVPETTKAPPGLPMDREDVLNKATNGDPMKICLHEVQSHAVGSEHKWEIDAKEVISRAVKDQLAQLKADFRRARVPLPPKRKKRIDRLQQLRHSAESDAEDDMWSWRVCRRPAAGLIYKVSRGFP